MSVMSVSTVTTAAIVEPDARGRLHEQVVAERRRDADADQPAPIARLARQRVALAPAEAIGADAQAFGEMALREWPLRMFGIDLGIVEDAKLDRIEPELLRHLVDRDFQRHHARRLARRAHGVAFGQIEHREPHRGHAVGAGVEQARLADRGLRICRPADRRTSSRGRWR